MANKGKVYKGVIMKKKTKIQIMSIYGEVLFEHESVDNTLKETVERAVSDGASLNWASLNGANLNGANLNGASLNWASLNRANLYGASLYRASLYGANLYGANLNGANLDGANLNWASLNWANLNGASLNWANLDGASLNWANLDGAKFSEPIYLSDLYSLKQLPKDTILNYWKYIKDGKSPIQDSGKIKYEVGKTYTEKDCNNNEYENCGAGLNVATIFWCLKETVNDNDVELIQCQFKVSDIVAIPYWTDGKFRVSKLKVIRKISRPEAIKELQELTGLS